MKYCGTWEFTLVWPLWLKVDPLVVGKSCGAAKPLAADLADKRIILLVHFDMSLEIVDCGETPPTAFKLTGVRPLLVVGLKVPLEFVRGGKGPAAALYAALVGAWVLRVVQEVNLKFLSGVKYTMAARFWAAKGGHSLFLGPD